MIDIMSESTHCGLVARSHPHTSRGVCGCGRALQGGWSLT